ncbi:rhodanese-like domain-containing protein [Colwellia sp. 4_MG-2023]|jgi:rhodanese-related sulfurtransferase|uniref:rhodanese-like domain-containing protein n=1 Tax=unclassified Colwellia TaxID=196834 RepID=UPI001C094BB5|nr:MULTISPECIES: rhodanese-like domain-containing protein [unclassified Colwellia]MBU2923123.1 rhodanese-like domain-containing protein [Colwellia sp. C2M11]MDO6488294.1 rhodanese-like domain-containing protein [Colwellia sp. 6_MG-2023]MDO6508267.1 rhodanese-like domain-containing protein [Colwellia sp. 5_MG-2023]MDO6556884.1 rhodanese-like domain-containing protein [Colwellia sp. 4_MG-2023]MDO6651448.1 rhodanese-like domain-containing protein [Colwellia sp. 3_MG-2023]
MLKTIPEVIAQARQSLNTITAADAVVKCKLENGIIIDVREPAEFAERSGDSTINIPRGLLEMKMLQMYPDENLAIFIHCATGARATFAAEQLNRVGYKNVWVVTCMLDDVCCVF